jgi:hypothetical protein
LLFSLDFDPKGVSSAVFGLIAMLTLTAARVGLKVACHNLKLMLYQDD